jgi:hypothetical protein
MGVMRTQAVMGTRPRFDLSLLIRRLTRLTFFSCERALGMLLCDQLLLLIDNCLSYNDVTEVN